MTLARVRFFQRVSSGGVCGHSERVSTTNANEAAGFVDDAEADGAEVCSRWVHVPERCLSFQRWCRAESCDTGCSSTFNCCQALFGIVHDVESELAAQFGEGFLGRLAQQRYQRRWTVSDLWLSTRSSRRLEKTGRSLEVLRRSMSNSLPIDRDPDGDIPGLDEVFDGEAVGFVTHAVPSLAPSDDLLGRATAKRSLDRELASGAL